VQGRSVALGGSRDKDAGCGRVLAAKSGPGGTRVSRPHVAQPQAKENSTLAATRVARFGAEGFRVCRRRRKRAPPYLWASAPAFLACGRVLACGRHTTSGYFPLPFPQGRVDPWLEKLPAQTFFPVAWIIQHG
jgi:hypothetical protein